LAFEYGWTVVDIFDLSQDELQLLLDRIIDRRKVESDAWSGKRSSSSSKKRNHSELEMGSDESLKALEMMMPGSVVE